MTGMPINCGRTDKTGRLTINKKAILDPSDVIAYRDASKLSAEDWSRRYELQGSSDGQR